MKVTFTPAPGQTITLPAEEVREVYNLAEALDCIVFWVGGGSNDGWQPLLMPRPYRARD